MKTIYCVEEWMTEEESARDNFFFFSHQPWSGLKFSFITEYEDEEEFKQSIADRISNGIPINCIFIKEIEDN